MAADSISYAVSVLSLLAIRAPEEPPRRESRQKLRTEIAEGLSFVLRDPILRKIVACTGTANLFGGMAGALEIIFLVRLLHVRPAGAGLLIAVEGHGGDTQGGQRGDKTQHRAGQAAVDSRVGSGGDRPADGQFFC